MTDHLWGIDKSHFDSPYGTTQIIAEGFSFMTHKAGGDAPDGELNTWWNDAKDHRAGILLGAYWVLYPGHGASAGDAFIARLDAQCPGWRDAPFILQLDCEQWQGNPATMPRLGDIRACALRLRQLAPKLVPIVYAPRWAYGNTLSGLGFPLWSSAYTAAKGVASAIYPGDSYTGWSAYSGIVPTVAQFASSGLVNGDPNTDVNCFKGTLPQLQAILCPGWLGDSMARNITDDDVAAIVTALRNADINPDPATNSSWAGTAWTTFLRTDVLNSLPGSVAAVAADVAYLKANPASIDSTALAAALAPALAPLISHDDPASLAVAIETAIRELVTNPAPAGNEMPAFDLPRSDGTPVYDEAADAVTRRLREQRQPDISGQ
jgi:hypothetical protein